MGKPGAPYVPEVWGRDATADFDTPFARDVLVGECHIASLCVTSHVQYNGFRNAGAQLTETHFDGVHYARVYEIQMAFLR